MPCRGGAGRFRAFHEDPRFSDRVFDLELLPVLGAGDAAKLRRLAHAVEVLAELRHPNVVRTVELHSEADRRCIVSELIDGVDLEMLRERFSELGLGIPPSLSLHIIGEILRGLIAAHETHGNGRPAPILHRCVAPRSVVLSYFGAVKLGGFAAAAAVEVGLATMAVSECLAPEQDAGDKGDPRSDLFAVGRLLDGLLGGPATAAGEGARASRVPPAFAEQIAAVIRRACERDPTMRFPTARAMLAALAPLLPTSPGVRLAIAGLARTACAEQLHQEQRWQRADLQPSGKVVALLAERGPATQALVESLLAAGLCTELHESPATLEDSLNGTLPPRAVFLDLDSRSIDLDELRQVLASVVAPAPVIAHVSDADTRALGVAYEIGAVDLLTRPVAAARIAVAVNAARLANVPMRRMAATSYRPESATKLLLVSADPTLAERLRDPMRHYGYQLDVVHDVNAALTHADRTSCLGVIHDAPDPQRADELVTRLRGLPTMGVIPVVRLVAGVIPELLEDRVAIRTRTDSAAVIGIAVALLQSDDGAVRTFKRFGAAHTAQVTDDGRVDDARAIDLSRGGVKLELDRVPPLGAVVEIELVGDGDPIRVTARVVRVDSKRNGPGRASHASFAFIRFAGHHESLLIAALRDLASGVGLG